jgi:hypothetical protein
MSQKAGTRKKGVVRPNSHLRKAFLCLVLLVIMAMSGVSEAKVGGLCSNCHTMHNSQGGQPMARGDAGWGGSPGSTNPNPQLLIASCLGCHSSTGSSAIEILGDGSKIPIVFNTAGYPNPPLAGGNFFFVSLGTQDNDTKGHNIFSDDLNLEVAPGDDGRACGNDSCHDNLDKTYSGAPPDIRTYGCGGCHLNANHHGNDHPPSQGGKVETAEQGWYRFLSGHMQAEGHGVEGYEDGDWEFSSGPGDHNEYKGKEVDGESGLLPTACGHTTTGFCTGCHPTFHADQGGLSSPFLRHPSDLVIPSSGEYANAFGGVYDPLVPVARLTVPDAPESTVSPGSDMVMCLSCHRAHGSQYDAILRWDYKDVNLSIAFEGCGKCHTSKN